MKRRISLRARMILGISVILVVVVAAYAVIALRAQSRYVAGVVEREAELVATVVQGAIASAMGAGKSDEVQVILERVGEQPDLARICVIDHEGRIQRSSRRDEVGSRHARWPAPGTVAHASAERGPTSRWDSAGQFYEAFRPIPNAAPCRRCHATDRPVLGFLAVSASVPAIDSEASQQWTVLILAAMAALLAAGVLIWIFFTVMVGRRVERLATTIRCVEAGDLAVRAPGGMRDELSELATSFNAMVARLADARARLESRHADEVRRAEHLAALGKMAAGVAHEINNPLAGMQNCVRTLLRGPRNDEQRVEYLGLLRDGLDRIARIVTQLLNFARESRPQLAPTPLPPVLHRCLALVEHETARRRIDVRVTGNGDVPAVLGDPHQLEQLFLNVLMNAVEAMPDGGRLDVGLRAGACDGKPAVEVLVSDTGPGIPAEHVARVFDPFFTTKEVGKGTGLGLSVSYGIVKAHRGCIAVTSAAGTGTTFTVALPVADGETHA
jgi:signal transduction histidine kinase